MTILLQIIFKIFLGGTVSTSGSAPGSNELPKQCQTWLMQLQHLQKQMGYVWTGSFKACSSILMQWTKKEREVLSKVPPMAQIQRRNETGQGEGDILDLCYFLKSWKSLGQECSLRNSKAPALLPQKELNKAPFYVQQNGMPCDQGQGKIAVCNCRCQKVKVWFLREVKYGGLQPKEGQENHVWLLKRLRTRHSQHPKAGYILQSQATWIFTMSLLLRKTETWWKALESPGGSVDSIINT